jgi:hypothetical protein
MKPMITVAFLLSAIPNAVSAKIITCTGEAITSRAIGGRQAANSAFSDSVIGPPDTAVYDENKNCYFFSDSPIGRRIQATCPIRDMDVSDKQGPICRVQAEVISKKHLDFRFNVIKRIIKVEQTEN